MPAQSQPATVRVDFAYSSDADLNEKIAAHRTAHEAQTGERLAMHARHPLGPGKVRITFRVVSTRSGRGR